jgi:ABC-2 type transport system ATP-binding protein
MTDNAIVVKGLQKSFGDLKVLRGIDFSVKRGSVLALLGPNGAGKTTTIRILSTLLQPDGGQALINGHV